MGAIPFSGEHEETLVLDIGGTTTDMAVILNKVPVLEPVGKSDAMEQLREQARKIARHNSWVLINGEPGAGKGTFKVPAKVRGDL